MKKIIIFSFALYFCLYACNNDDEKLSPPNNVSDISLEAREGGVMIKWEKPDSVNYLYIQSRYEKLGRSVVTNSSIYTDSVLINGLLNKYEYSFEIQSYNQDLVGSDIIKTDPVRPIKRSPQVIYDLESAKDISLSADMLETYTQENSEGPKENLVDGNINTYWHSAWSSGVSPLPHWIQVNFDEPTKVGGFIYWFRQNNDENGRPCQWDVQISADGVDWKTAWESQSDLPTSPVDEERLLSFGKNIESNFFRFRILKNPGDKTFTHLGEFQLFELGEKITDMEAEAEKNYK